MRNAKPSCFPFFVKNNSRVIKLSPQPIMSPVVKVGP